MAPELTITNRMERSRWHGQGKEINADTIDEILEQAGMNWTVSKRPIVTTCAIPEKTKEGNPELMSFDGTKNMGDFRCSVNELIKNPTNEEIRKEVVRLFDETNWEYIPHTNEFSIVRNDINVPFTTMGRIYECLSNRTCIEMLEPLLKEGKCIIERAGTFNDGANCWIVAKLPDRLEVAPGETVDQYIKLSWSHDGSEKLSATFICLVEKDNIQFSPKVSAADTSIEIRHTTNAQKRIEIATNLFQKGQTYFKQVEELLGSLVTSVWTEKDMEKYLEALLPESTDNHPDAHGYVKESQKARKRNEIMSIFSDNNSSTGHTKYSAYTAVVQHCDHNKTIKIPKKKQENKSEGELITLRNESHLMGIWLKSGSGRKMKDRALNLIIK